MILDANEFELTLTMPRHYYIYRISIDPTVISDDPLAYFYYYISLDMENNVCVVTIDGEH